MKAVTMDYYDHIIMHDRNMPEQFTSQVMPLWKGLGSDCLGPLFAIMRMEAPTSRTPLTFTACRHHYHNMCDAALERLGVLSILSWR
jgi:hypothetical protein